MNGAAAMVRCLEAEGITRIFGYPGVAIAPFYEEVFASGSIEHVLVRQEPVSYTHLDVYKRQAVFCSRYRAWREVRTLERLLFFSSRRASWKTSSFWIRSTARRAFLQASSISSISLLRPRRLLEFLKAPPLMEPPGLKRSPSGVTMRME